MANAHVAVTTDVQSGEDELAAVVAGNLLCISRFLSLAGSADSQLVPRGFLVLPCAPPDR